MTARAQAAAQTGERILDAAIEVFWQHPTDRISLDEVAARADVSVQTVIRRFGGRDGVLAAAAERESARVAAQRELAPVGDLPGAVAVLVDHYEQLGERVLRMLAEENRIPAIRTIIEGGRELHRRWCAQVFGAALVNRVGVERRRRLAQIVAVCDVYTWKLLRADAGLSRRQTELAMVELLAPLMAA
ncbi:MAG: helix-turn-helix domain-containing protein [Jatrophihabitantaceae bacterium]